MAPLLVPSCAEDVVEERVPLNRRAEDLVVPEWPLAGVGAPEGPGATPVARVDHDAGRAAVEAHARERGVELVDEERGTDAHVVHLLEARVDRVLVAGRRLEVPAAEQLGDLDLQHHRHPALVDHAARVVGVGHDLEEALARPACLSVHVALQLVHVLEAVAHRRHLVARVLLPGHELAQDPVVVDRHHHQPQAAQVGALDPPPVVPFVREVVGPPLGELGPAGRVVRLRRVAVVEEVLEWRSRALRPLDLGAVGERVGDPVAMPWPAAMEFAAEVAVVHPVHVALEDPADLAVGGLALRGLAAGVQLGLGVDRAAVGGGEDDLGRGVGNREGAALGGALADAEEQALVGKGRKGERGGVVHRAYPPVGCRARRLLGHDGAVALGREQHLVRRVEEIGAEVGGLHPHLLCASARLPRHGQRVAAACERVAGRGGIGGERWRRAEHRDRERCEKPPPNQPPDHM